MKLKKNILSLVVLLIVSACGNNDNASPKEDKATDISILVGKPEIIEQIEAAVAEFNDTHDNINASIIPLAGQNAYEKMTALYSSGNAPNVIMMGQEFSEFQENLLDLSDQEWVDTAQAGTTDFVTVDDKIYGMPVTVEAFGFLYNKSIVEEAVGGDFDPHSINSRSKLEDLLDDIAALENTEGIHITPVDWSLGAHWTNIFFTDQSEDRDKRHEFVQDLKDGDVNLADNDVFNGWLDTFELAMEYNSDKDSPLSPQYDDGPLNLANGDVGLWFMGNWAYPELKEANPDADGYGFLPVPISDNPDDYGNKQISVGVPSYWVVDASEASEAEQDASKEFLNWLVFDETGQDYVVNKFNFIPVFDNIEVVPEDSVSRSVLKYMEEENTLEWINTYYPPDASASMGASLQKFLAGNTDRAGFIDELEDYWKNAK